MHVQSSVIVNRPIDEAFGYVADFRNDPAWRAEVRELRLVSGEVAVGTHAIETSVLWGRRVVTETVITALEPNRLIAFDYVSGPFRVQGRRTCEPVDGGTRVTVELEWHPTSRVARVLQPAMAGVYQRTIERYVAHLGTILDEGR